MTYLLLGLSIACEVFGATMLKFSDGFHKLLPTLGVVAGYGLTFYTLSLVLQKIPLGVAYGTWAGVGTLLTTACGMILFKERIKPAGFAGLVILILGLILLNLSH